MNAISTQQDSTTTDAMTTDVLDTEAPAATVYEKGTWQASLHRSAVLFDKSTGDRKRASTLLWQGAVAAIADWEPNSGTDVSGEGLYTEVLDILGTPRKGDASKIKTVAVAVRNSGLILSLYPNLSKAYAEARRLTSTVQQHQAEDDAADKAIEVLAAEAPHSASTPENAAKIVLRAGLDEAARLLLDALGATNEAAHRSLLRALSNEIAGRVKPKVSTVKAGPKAGATQATPGGASTTPKATVKATTKAKAPATKATPKHATKATPVKPGAKAAPVKAQATTPVKATAPAHTTADAPVKAAAKADAPAPVAAKPVAVKPVAVKAV